MLNRARFMAAMSVVAATYLLFSTPSVRGAELAAGQSYFNAAN